MGIKHVEIESVIQRLIEQLIGLSDDAGEFLLSYDGGKINNCKVWKLWDWAQGVGLYGLMKRVERCNDPKALAEINRWFTARAAEPMVAKNINSMAPILTAVGMAARTNDPKWHALIHEWGEWVMHDLPRTEEGGFQHTVIDKLNDQELWDDTLMMTVLALTRIGLLLNRPHYVEEAKRQFMVHARYLTDTETGLWFHGWCFKGRHNFARALWARGNSWVTIAIPEFLEMLALSPADSLRLFLQEVLATQVKALAKRQRSDGLWHTILDDDTAYPEASATAGFAYGIMKAVRLGYLPDHYLRCGTLAAEIVFTNISDSGELRQVSFGTPMFYTVDEYKKIPLTAMPYGQAMAMLALEEYLLADQT
jgi:unsaturated rhamnogalacturonyl hydrolase